MKNLCNICPRECKINRENLSGYCSGGNSMRISKVMLHKWEEPCISGNDNCVNNQASGAIFFSGCNLRCIYCQNYNISQQNAGKNVSIQGLVSIFKQLEKKGALNINLVTPTHYTNQIIEALKIYKPAIPVIWNSSGYEKPETIQKLSKLVDIFLVDFKYFDSKLAEELSNAQNYPSFAKEVILECRKQQPIDVFDDSKIMKKGLIIRHLCLPNCTTDSKNIINWINDNLGNQTIVSLMSQYVPMHKAKENKLINRKLKPIEYKVLVAHLNSLGFKNAYIQDFDSQNTSYTPDFENDDTDFIY